MSFAAACDSEFPLDGGCLKVKHADGCCGTKSTLDGTGLQPCIGDGLPHEDGNGGNDAECILDDPGLEF